MTFPKKRVHFHIYTYTSLRHFLQDHFSQTPLNLSKLRQQFATYNINVKVALPYVLFKYASIKTRFPCKALRECRGVILCALTRSRKDECGNTHTRTQWHYVCRPWLKTFNMGKQQSYTRLSAPRYRFLCKRNLLRLSEKVDGTCVTLWRELTPPFSWRVSTLGALTPGVIQNQKGHLDDALTFDALFWQTLGLTDTRKRHAFLRWCHPSVTFMFELVTPYNHVHNTYLSPAVVLLDARHVVTGRFMSTETLCGMVTCWQRSSACSHLRTPLHTRVPTHLLTTCNGGSDHMSIVTHEMRAFATQWLQQLSASSIGLLPEGVMVKRCDTGESLCKLKMDSYLCALRNDEPKAMMLQVAHHVLKHTWDDVSQSYPQPYVLLGNAFETRVWHDLLPELVLLARHVRDMMKQHDDIDTTNPSDTRAIAKQYAHCVHRLTLNETWRQFLFHYRDTILNDDKDMVKECATQFLKQTNLSHNSKHLVRRHLNELFDRHVVQLVDANS